MARPAIDMAVFAEAKQQFPTGFLQLKNGVPSHDTFSRMFRQVDPEQFRTCCQKFVSRFGETRSGVIAIDGKTLRPSLGARRARSPLHMISAWCCDKRLVLAHIATNAKSNERPAVFNLLEFLSLKDSIVTADALNCQQDIA